MKGVPAMRKLLGFLKSTEGLAAVEFAFILPVMIIMFLGTVEVSNYVVAARRVASLASTGADLSAQDTSLSNADMTDIFGALTTIMDPLSPAVAKIRITSVVADANGTTYRVAWSDARNIAPRVVGSVVTAAEFPTGLLAAFQGAIMCEVTYGYDPMFAKFMHRVDITDTFYLKPRKSLTVARTP
jgi:Flp pilus assembly protein TadG